MQGDGHETNAEEQSDLFSWCCIHTINIFFVTEVTDWANVPPLSNTILDQ